MPGNPLSRLLPVAMVVGTVGMMVVYLTSGASATRNPMFMFFPVMMVGSLLGTMVSGTRGGGRVAEINQDRRDYLRYLASLESSIVNTADDQRLSLVWSSPDPDLLWTMIGGRRMWERRPDDADFGAGSDRAELSTPVDPFGHAGPRPCGGAGSCYRDGVAAALSPPGDGARSPCFAGAEGDRLDRGQR